MTKPLFIVLDGIDGVGKTTQIQRLTDWLTDLGHDVICVHDPGGTEIGTQLRRLLLDSDLEMHRRTEAMLFMASRCELVETVIRPALEAGKTVISDRFLLANVVYQSIGGGKAGNSESGTDSAGESPGALWELGQRAIAGFQPDLTLLLDMPAAAAMKRLDRPADRMEQRGTEYLEQVRQAFLKQLPRSSGHTAVVDAGMPPDDVAAEISRAIRELLPAIG